jgi:WD40-like Beta Propeller Repeat
MQKRTMWLVVGIAMLIAAALLLRILPDTCRIDDVLAVYQEQAEYPDIAIDHPLDETLFPPEMPPPLFCWNDGAPSEAWLVRIMTGGDQSPQHWLTRRPNWTPPLQDWENIKRRSREHAVQVVILGVRPGRPPQVLSRTQVSFQTSSDPVAAPLFYREVNLPFLEADKDPSRIRWRFGSIASPEPPPVVLEKLPVCGNCHSFDRDGTTLAMDVDYADNKGSYVIADVKEQMALTPDDIITWHDYQGQDGAVTFGLLSQISPDGRYVVSTVKDMSIFIPRPPLAFSQLFFPIKGILCIFDRQSRQFRALPGADDPAFVQSNAMWSPDGKHIVFARARAADLQHTKGQGLVGITRAECEEFIADGRPFRFDLYRIPFNDGAGGVAEPLAGASHNGMSNYFARYSPDGRWIVFCRANSYMLLQPDSELTIIPAEGGAARRLRCNTNRMNSWHSFSPNGKWLVFSSKACSDYTQLFLTHIDENGCTTPPALLAHLTAPDRAGNIPEFVNTRPDAIASIQERFLQDR